MQVDHLLAVISPWDIAALALLLCAWLLIGWRIEHPGRTPSVTVLMAGYRREWMRQYVRRENRIFDAQLLGTLRQGTSFFASTSLLSIGAVLALVGNTAPLENVAQELGQDTAPALLWQVKLLVVALFLAQAFLRFVWSHRLFGYCAVVMGAVPAEPGAAGAEERAAQAAELNIRAAWNFNRGLRAMYFSLGALAWLLGPAALALAAAVVTWVLWSREFASASRKVLQDAP
ncbi:DUF599 domain-containing protein [Pseudoroseicyclus tamaricis]|uniref:DUF599 domain-containing protein n=1 Tax=Pseudoroseicyclus tamaricis TaxID=2705421 RepID=A0A6B2JWT9_9RHOB|nr:DUF599 domain-containing protein [Pseudoroseicyclus tamaricis]NDV02375.1 DUF599 domain-containing protein [Pseudoroseicyclus tamaricis]